MHRIFIIDIVYLTCCTKQLLFSSLSREIYKLNVSHRVFQFFLICFFVRKGSRSHSFLSDKNQDVTAAVCVGVDRTCIF
jgi:hypothetical protein